MNVINHNDTVYKIKREVKQHNFTYEGQIHLDVVKEFKEFLNCDHVLQKGDAFLFCEEIPSIEWEEIT